MFLILLLLALAASYYIAGLFKLDDVTIQNYQDKLAYILMHPFRNWFNRKTPAVIGIALTAWAMFVCYYLTYYRNFHPDVENYFIVHGYVSNDRTDYNTLIPVLEKHQKAFGSVLEEVTADSG